MMLRCVPRVGPWFMFYRNLPGTFGVMVNTSGHDAVLSGGALGVALAVGWRFPKRTLRERKHLFGRDRG